MRQTIPRFERVPKDCLYFWYSPLAFMDVIGRFKSRGEIQLSLAKRPFVVFELEAQAVPFSPNGRPTISESIVTILSLYADMGGVTTIMAAKKGDYLDIRKASLKVHQVLTDGEKKNLIGWNANLITNLTRILLKKETEPNIGIAKIVEEKAEQKQQEQSSPW